MNRRYYFLIVATGLVVGCVGQQTKIEVVPPAVSSSETVQEQTRTETAPPVVLPSEAAQEQVKIEAVPPAVLSPEAPHEVCILPMVVFNVCVVPPLHEICSTLLGHCIKHKTAELITTKTNCTYHDPSGGYGGKLKLAVDKSQVDTLVAEIQTRHGKCNFALKDFQQTEKEPVVKLKAKRGKCVVRVWTQEDKISVAFEECKDRCQRDSFDYVWPIGVNTKTGRCF
jgi:hypothetical protein